MEENWYILNKLIDYLSDGCLKKGCWKLTEGGLAIDTLSWFMSKLWVGDYGVEGWDLYALVVTVPEVGGWGRG